MIDSDSVYHAISTALGTLDHREATDVGIFDDAISMLQNIGYDAAAVYIIDDYPDALRLGAECGNAGRFPEMIPIPDEVPPDVAVEMFFEDEPDIYAFPLFCYGQKMGALAVRADKNPRTDKALTATTKIFSVLAYIDMVRTNCQRERAEREIYFAQALTNRLMLQEPPETEYYRLGFERWRALEVGGDFYDFIPVKDGRVYAFIGRCSGKGMKTALQMVEIMHHIDRSFVSQGDMLDIVREVNQHLVKIKNRTHLASLCLMEMDPYAEKVRLVRTGNFGIAICHPDHLHNISSEGELFLGMINNLEMAEEEFEFKPGSAIICATEGIFSIKNRLDQTLTAAVFDTSIQEAHADNSMKALINLTFDRIRHASDFTRAQESIAAISIEFMDKKQG